MGFMSVLSSHCLCFGPKESPCQLRCARGTSKLLNIYDIEKYTNRVVCLNYGICEPLSATTTFHFHCKLSRFEFENSFNTLRPRQNGRHIAADTFKCIFLFENVWIWIKFSLKFVPGVRINNIPALVQVMAWRRIGDKPLCEPMMVNLLTHICVTRPQWVKTITALDWCHV